MTKEQINTYVMRISQANVSGLAVILYDMVLDCIEEGLQAYEAEEGQRFEQALGKGQSFLQELMSMSRLDTQTGCDVMSIYLYVDKQLLMSVVKQRPVRLEECRGYLERLRSSFVEISSRDDSPPLMEHTQQVYAGLTYGKGYLKESRDPMEERSRGLQA